MFASLRSVIAILARSWIPALIFASLSSPAQNIISPGLNPSQTGSATTPLPARGAPWRSLAPAAAEPSSLFPHVVVGGGYSTVFSFLNTGSATLSGTLILTAADGTPMKVNLSGSGAGFDSPNELGANFSAGSTMPITVPPGGASFITASATSPEAPAQTGWARVESYGGFLGGVATFRKADASGSMLTSAGVLSAAAVEAATIPVDDDRSRNRYTGFAIANPCSESIFITGTLIEGDLEGSPGRFTISLGPGQQAASYFFQNAPLPEVFKGSAVLTAQGGKRFSVVALVQNSSHYSALPAIPTLPAAQAVLALTHGTVIDGTGAGPLRDAVVLINDDHIAAVGPAAEVSIPAGARIIDVRGATILPGFINTHVHSAFVVSNLLAWAQAGVTTVRDLGFQAVHMWWPMTFRDQNAQDSRFARIVTVGAPISSPGGYPLENGKTTVLTAASPEEARSQTNLVLDHGADLIKACLDSGAIVYGRANLPMFTREEAKAIIDAAHRRGVPVSVHVTATMDLAKAVDYGFDEIAHMVADELKDETLIARMVAGDIHWVPTLELWSFFNLAPVAVENLRRFVSAGGKVALGTDFSGAAKPFQLGMPMRELELMGQAGMTPMQIIVAATKNAAHVCNRDRTLGTLERGKLADLLVVNGDPLQDIHVLANVRLVVRNGTVIRNTGN